MTFGGEVKNELCRAGLSRKCCAQAEAYGVLLYCNTFCGSEIRIVTEHEAFAQRLPALFRKAFRLSFDRLPEGEGKRVFSIQAPDKLRLIHQTYGVDPEALALHINFAALEESCCRAAFFRGAFLSGGSVTDPGRATTWSWPPPTAASAGRCWPCCGRRSSPPRTPTGRETP